MKYVTKEIQKKEIRKVLDKYIDFKEYNITDEEYTVSKGINNSIIGSSFEILFQIEKLKYEKKEMKIERMKFFRGYILISSCFKKIGADDKIKELLRKSDAAIEIINKYLSNKKVNNKSLMKSILFLDFISLFREPKQIYYYKEKFGSAEVKELILLKDNIGKKILKKYKGAYFNYGVSFKEIAGEIDILVEEKIIDMKSTNYPIFTKDMIFQLVMYWYVCKKSGISIEKIGIFFTRFNKVEMFKVKNIVSKKLIKELDLIYAAS